MFTDKRGHDNPGWAVLRWVFTPLVLAAVVAGIVGSCLLACGTSQPGSTSPTRPSGTPVLIDRTVQIRAVCTEGRSWTGSGVILVAEPFKPAYVATAEHVANTDEDCAYSVTRQGADFPAVVLEEDADHDVSLLETGFGILVDMPRLEDAYGKLDDEVVTTGYPYDHREGKTWLTVTRGRLAAIYDDGFYRITASIQPGSSGGPCWTTDGRLVGLTVSMMVDGHRNALDGHYYVSAASNVFELLEKRVPRPPPEHPHYE